jgi:hypothetical protein
MANTFKLYSIHFESVFPNSTDISGIRVLGVLSGFIDTDSADVKLDENGLDIKVVTSFTEDRVLFICDEVKKSLEKSGDGRLLYKVKTISL